MGYHGIRKVRFWSALIRLDTLGIFSLKRSLDDQIERLFQMAQQSLRVLLEVSLSQSRGGNSCPSAEDLQKQKFHRKMLRHVAQPLPAFKAQQEVYLVT